MQSDIDRARLWRVAFVALFVCMLGGSVSLSYVSIGGPGLLFYVAGGTVAALLGLDLWIRVRHVQSKQLLDAQEEARSKKTAKALDESGRIQASSGQPVATRTGRSHFFLGGA